MVWKPFEEVSVQVTEVNQEIIDLEHEYWRAMRDRDAKAALALTE